MAQEFTDFDRAAMQRAIDLARLGLETTQPNPRVGCVIASAGRIIGEGWHERAGGPHAEVAALRATGGAAAGATVYVTLEPCSHHGRTPPCVDGLIAARIARVVYAQEDPNPKVAGRGAAALARAGIRVEAGLLAVAAEELNPGFLKRMRVGTPFVRVKLGMSLDAHTALANGASRWITGSEARSDVQHYRAQSSAVLTGIGTVLADDPRLDVRLPDCRRQPLRVVLDSQLRTPPAARLLAAPGEVLIFTTADDESRRARLEQDRVRVERAPGGARPDLAAVLRRLAELEVNELLLEAGATLSGAFIQAGLVDELLIYVAPVLLGPQARPLVDLPELRDLRDGRRFEIMEASRIGSDLRLRLRAALAPIERA